MAIDRGALDLWARINGQLPRRPAVLEVGRANWFGDVDPASVPELRGVPDVAELMTTGLGLYRLATLYYTALLDPTCLDAVDNGAPGAWAWDLNRPLPLTRSYDLVINTGTTEHVFDQARVFRTIHDATVVGGVMVHSLPVGGCVDHGFYNYQPCLLEAMARTNGYAELARLEREIGGDRILHLAWRRTRPGSFVVPQQGVVTAGVMGGQFAVIDRGRPVPTGAS